jgi:mannosyltransferase
VTTSHISRSPDRADATDGSLAVAGGTGDGVLRWVVPAVPGLVALGFGLWRLTGPGIWRDEAATYSIAQRSLSQLWKMTGNVDAVHGFYYLLIHLDFAVFGPSVVALRLPSVLAGAGTAALLAVIGARLANRRVGVLAGLFWAVLPQVSRYMQEGRSTSLVSLSVVAGAYFLVRRKWIAFAIMAALAGALNLIAALSLVAFAVTVLLWRLLGAADNRTLVRALAATVVAFAAGAVPVALRSRGEAAVLNWIPRPDRQTWVDLLTAMSGSHRMVLPLLVIAFLGCGLTFWRGERRLAALALPLAVLPPALLIWYSLVETPAYVLRYVLYAFIGAAWLFGLGIDAVLSLAGRLLRRLGRVGRVVDGALGLTVGALVLALFAAPGWALQTHIRTVDGHDDPLLRLAQAVRDNSRPGDGVLFFPDQRRYTELAYPSYFHNTTDLMLATSPAQAGDLYGEEYPLSDLTSRLRGYNRVWVVWNRAGWVGTKTDGFARMRADGYKLSGTWMIDPSQQVLLYAKSH